MNAELSQSEIDAQLEAEIALALRVMLEAPDDKAALNAFYTMRELIECRSPRQIGEMELRMGA